MTTTTARVADNLQHIVTLWPHLADMLDTRHSAPWPPAGRMTDYLAALDQADAEEVRAARELEVPSGRPPIRLDIFDTARAVERVLVDTADQIASAVQRPSMSAAPADWPPLDRLRRNTLAAADRNDRRRWSYTDPRSRTAVLAAIWLQHRLDGGHGPFEPLSPLQRDHIAMVAAGAVQRIETALDLTRRTTRPGHACPHCRELVTVQGGDGHAPAVRCTSPDCGWTRSAEAVA